MSTHTDILALLHSDFAEDVPRLDVAILRVNGIGIYGWHSNVPVQKCAAHDARAHIELAAWKAVRGWCSNNNSDLTIMDATPGCSPRCCICCNPWSRMNGEVLRTMGNAPDDATALLAALRYIKERR